MPFFKKIYDGDCSDILLGYSTGDWLNFMAKEGIASEYEIGKGILEGFMTEIQESIPDLSNYWETSIESPSFLFGNYRRGVVVHLFYPYSILCFTSALAIALRRPVICKGLFSTLTNLLLYAQQRGGDSMQERNAFDWFPNVKQNEQFIPGFTVTMVMLYGLDDRTYIEYVDSLSKDVKKAILLACLVQATPIDMLFIKGVPGKIRDWVLENDWVLNAETDPISEWVSKVVGDGTNRETFHLCSDDVSIEDIKLTLAEPKFATVKAFFSRTTNEGKGR